MKYSFKSIVALLLCIVMLGTTVLTSCDSGESSGGEKDTSQSTTNNGNGNDESNTDDGGSTDNGGDKTPEDTTVVASGVTLNKSTLALLKGGSETLTATIAPSDTTDKTLTWTSSNTSIATVANGTVTAISAGAATITVTTANGKTATCEVTVSILASGVTLDKTSIQINEGETHTLTATVVPTDATDKSLTWESSNMSIATVVNGTVTAVKAGTATITVTTANGKTAVCEVTVIANGISFKTLGFEGTNVYGKVSNTTTIFSFITEVGTSGNATFEVYRDLECSNIIQSKTTSLAIGDNTFYILEKIGGEVNALYTVTVRRKPMYTVTFDANGGTAVESQTIEEDSCVTVPTTERTGYTFAGWNRDLSLPITGHTTITAQWSNNPYTVTYNANGGEVSATTIEVGYGQTYTLTEPTRTGYTFDGWYYGEQKLNLAGVWSISDNITVKAEWIANKYTIMWKNWDGSLLGTTLVEYDNMPSYNDTPQRENDAQHYYVFSGWSPQLAVVTGEATYTAQFTQHLSEEYAVKYNLNGGNGSLSTQTKQKEQAITIHDTVPTRTDYVFVGWNNIYEDKIYNAGDILTLDCNVTLWAMWQEVSDCTNCKGTGETTSKCGHCNEGSICYKCNKNTGIIIINGLGRVCDKCGFWSRKTCTWCNGNYIKYQTCYSCDGNGYSCIHEAAPSVSDIYARKIVLNALDGYEYSLDGITWQSSPIFEGLDPHTSYSFYQRRATNTNVPFGITSSAATFTTKDDTTYYITYDLNGGSNHQDNPSSYETTATAITLLNPTKEHYEFDGWMYNGNPVTSIDPSWNDDVILIANWKVKAYVITYALNGGSASNPTTHGIGSDVITLAEPTKTGYTFIGWTGSNGSTPEIEVTIAAGSTGDLSYTANWSLNVYTVTYELNGGILADANPESYSVENAVVLNTPTKKNYEFLGWYDGDTKITSLVGIYKDLSLEAKWKSIFIVSDNSITGLTQYGKENYTELDIPSVIGGTNITGIGSYAFYGCTKLTSITIPDSVTSIGANAFYGCTNIQSATISTNAISSIPKNNLKTVVITSGTSIDNDAFKGCTKLTSITIPDSVTSIANGAFSGCTGLTSITLPFIGAAKDGTSNTHFGYIFGASSYYSNENYVPESLKKVIITGGTSIDSYVFYYCKGLTSITIPDSVTSIGSSAFQGCTRLTSITIPDSVTSIEGYAFYNCYKLVEVYDLSPYITVTKGSTGNGYVGCFALDVYTSASAQSKLWTTSDGFMFYEDGDICYLMGYSGTETDITLPADCHGNNYEIYKYAFYDCTGLTSITIPDGVTSIGNYAFYYYYGLTSVTIGNGVESIGERAFYKCTSLTSITIGNGVTSIGERAFYDCTGLTSITIPDGVTSIGNYAFYGCTGLTSITIPDSVTSIGDYAFRDCTGLTSINIPNGVTSIGDYAFCDCTGLTSINIPNGVTSIGAAAFSGCRGLTSITIPDSVTSIGAAAFSSCIGLTSINIPNGVTSIDVSAFHSCTSLTSITIPDSVTSIGGQAFRDCRGLTSITIPDSVTSIDFSAFEGCTGLTSITIGNGVMSIAISAFRDCRGLTSIQYRGTEEQWNAITKGSTWDSGAGNYTITFNYTGE